MFPESVGFRNKHLLHITPGSQRVYLGLTSSCAMLPLYGLPASGLSYGINICCVFQGLEGSLLPSSSKILDKLTLYCQYLFRFVLMPSKRPTSTFINGLFKKIISCLFYREEFNCVDLLSSISKKGVIKSRLLSLQCPGPGILVCSQHIFVYTVFFFS